MRDQQFSFTFVVRQKGGIHQGFHRRIQAADLNGFQHGDDWP
jgi:hypothetical protein